MLPTGLDFTGSRRLGLPTAHGERAGQYQHRRDVCPEAVRRFPLPDAVFLGELAQTWASSQPFQPVS